MRVLVAHNHYQQPGGEDAVVEDEKRLLRENGDEVYEYEESNEGVLDHGAFHAARRVIWSSESFSKVKQLIGLHRPDVAHFHNTFMMISPSAYDACNESGVPVIQTLHNYRLSCPSATHFRDGHVCEDCLGRSFAWPAVIHACYRGSRPQSAVLAAMTAFHRARRTWTERVDTYIALTEFGKRHAVDAGLPSEKIVIKPNFAFDSATPVETSWPGEMALFIGRLSTEKGVSLLLQAWRDLRDVPLAIAGDGPLRAEVEERARENPDVTYVGHQSRVEVVGLMRRARFVLVPSVCYEGFPRAIVESYACGKPVIASRLGAMQELVRHGQTGFLFSAGSATDLRTIALQLWNDVPTARAMGAAARRKFEAEYTAERNYEHLIAIYRKAIALKQ